jgi:hypothetical protein
MFQFKVFILQPVPVEVCPAKFSLKGNPVKNGNYPRSCDPDAKIALYFLKLQATVPIYRDGKASENRESQKTCRNSF